MSPFSALPGRHVDVWYTRLSEVEDPRLLEQYRSLLRPDEFDREQRFVVERARHQFRVTRALIRWTLSQYCDVAPADWIFRQDAYGKPSVVAPAGYDPVFNLSHTSGLVACAISTADCVGVDVEYIDRKTAGIDLARRYFAPDEVRLLEQTPVNERQRVFFQIWTLKESYIKAVGKGLAIPLDSFWFALPPRERPRISFDSRRDDEPQRWQFAQMQFASRHQLAIGAASPSNDELIVHCRRVIPLDSYDSTASVCDRSNDWSATVP